MMVFATAFGLSDRVRGSFPDIDFRRVGLDGPLTRETLGILESADALYASQGFLTRENLGLMPGLKWVQVQSAGYERACLPAMRERGIVFTNARGVYSIPIAEDVICRMICLARDYPGAMRDQTAHRWNRAPKALELCGRTLGLVGTGSIAVEVAVRAKAMGMVVAGVNRSGTVPAPFDRVGTGRDALLRLAAESDFLVVTVPLEEGTRNLIDDAVLSAMGPKAFLINIARGSVVDEGALIAKLRERAIAGAGLDVFETEPLCDDSPLWGMDNVIITPHTSGTGDGVLGRLEALLTANLRAFPDADRMVNVICR